MSPVDLPDSPERPSSAEISPAPKGAAPTGGAASVAISLPVLAILGILALLDYAGSVFITIFSSILIAIALDPPVGLLNRKVRLPRHFGSMVVVVLAVGFLYGMLYLAYLEAQGFLIDLPALADRIRTAPIFDAAARKFHGIEKGVEAFSRRLVPPIPVIEKGAQVVVNQGQTFTATLFSGLGSITTIIFSLSFIPFLVYFILAEKESLTRRTLALFPGREEQIHTLLTEIEGMMQTFLVGNVIIAGVLSFLTIVLFWGVGLPYWFVLGALSGILSTVPYLGLLLALVPGVVVGLVYFDSGLPLLIVAAGVTAFHLVAANYLVPRLVGGRTHLNAVSSTLSILFFGWMWGGMGLLLAIPIAAVLRCVLDSNPSTRRIGQWLGDEGR